MDDTFLESAFRFGGNTLNIGVTSFESHQSVTYNSDTRSIANKSLFVVRTGFCPSGKCQRHCKLKDSAVLSLFRKPKTILKEHFCHRPNTARQFPVSIRVSDPF